MKQRSDGRRGLPRPRPAKALLTSCLACGRLHRPDRPLEFNPLCASCRVDAP